MPDFPGIPDQVRRSLAVYPKFWELAAESIRYGVMSLTDMERTLPVDRKTIRKHMQALGCIPCGPPHRVDYVLADARRYAIWLANPKVPSSA